MNILTGQGNALQPQELCEGFRALPLNSMECEFLRTTGDNAIDLCQAFRYAQAYKFAEVRSLLRYGNPADHSRHRGRGAATAMARGGHPPPYPRRAGAA